MSCNKSGLVRFMTIGLLVSITALGTGTNAQANHSANRDNFTGNYGSTGKWKIIHGDADSCVADIDNNQVTLRIKYTDYTADMHIGMPYYGHQNTVLGDFGFSRRTNISIEFDTSVIESWAMAVVDVPFENKLQSESQIGFILDRGLQMFSLNGASNAIAMLKECAKNAGVRPRNQVTQNNNRNNNQIATAPSQEQHYASVRGWSVKAVFGNSGFVYCGATIANRGLQMRIAHGSGKWGIGLETFRAGSMYGQLSIDYKNGRNVQAGSITYTNDGDGWAAAPLNWEFLEHLKQGTNVSLEIGEGFKTFSLSGSTAAILKVEECVRNQGRKPSYNTRPQNQPQQNVQRNQRRNNNSYIQTQKSSLSGIWVWSDYVKNSKNNAIVSTLTMTGNNGANYCYGLFCWDVIVQKQPDNSVNFSTDGVNHFEFWETGTNRISGRFWENYNSRGAPHATVNMK